MHCEKRFINTHGEAPLASKLVVSASKLAVSDKIRQPSGTACLGWQG